MTFEIAFVLILLVVAMILFMTEILRMDVVALLVMCVLAVTGMVTPEQALSGFSNSAVVTVWAMFVLSGGLTVTGVANIIGQQVLWLAGRTETRMVAVIMLTSGIMSAIMNNIGVAALLLPVVMDIAKRTGVSPSKLLMPLAYGSLLGGLTTLIGTPPNLLASEALRVANLQPFGLFDFTPTGIGALIGGTLFVVLVGRFFLPNVKPSAESLSQQAERAWEKQYALHERMFVLKLPAGSALRGRTLAAARFGSAAGLTVVAIMRNGQTMLAPRPSDQLQQGDRLLVSGRSERFEELRGWQDMVVEGKSGQGSVDVMQTVSNDIGLGELILTTGSSLVGKTLVEIDFRVKYGVNVLAFRRDGEVIRRNLAEVIVEEGDVLLVQGARSVLNQLPQTDAFEAFVDIDRDFVERVYDISAWIYVAQIPTGSALEGKSLSQSRLGDAFGLQVLSIVREDQSQLLPDPGEILQAGDYLLIKGKPEDLSLLRGYREIEIEQDATPYLGAIESQPGQMEEVVLAPRNQLAGKTPRELHFRERYGLQILAIWRGGRAYRSALRDMRLQFGDALLLLGSTRKFKALSADADFLVLSEQGQEVTRPRMAPVAALILVAVLVPVLLGWLPIAISAVAGITTMILTRCISMEEAYGFIEWRPIFLIAGMLPLGVAMQDTGAANYVAENMVALIGHWGPWAVIIGLYLLTTFATMVVPTAALVVLMAPICIKSSAEMGISPYATMMAVAMAASASFTSPISHPANILVMGPGGYRFIDYMKLGIPLTLVVMVVVLLLLPIFWPFYTT